MDTLHCNDFPRHPTTNLPLRPNVLMFGDYGWIPDRTQAFACCSASFLIDVVFSFSYLNRNRCAGGTPE